MRTGSLVCLSALTLALTACDATTSPRAAGLGTNTTGTSALVISPNVASLAVGATLQLATNQSASGSSNIEWGSNQSLVAAVSPSGLVTAIAPGTATIIARLASDTTVSATATVTVTP